MWFDHGYHVACSTNISHGLIDHTGASMHFIGVDVQMNFHFSIRKYWGQSLEQLTHSIYFVHESQAGSICPLVVITLSVDLSKNLAAVATIPVHHYHGGVFCPPYSIFFVSFGIRTQIDACVWALSGDEFRNFRDVYPGHECSSLL